jgi:cobalt-zinc-cadmium efflux system protein
MPHLHMHDHAGHDHAGHSEHDHSEHDHSADLGTGRLVLAITLNVGITAAEFAAGLFAGSLALLADAAHNLSDAGSLGISWYARRVARRAPDRQRTFGYRRAEVVGAFVNLLTLVLIAGYLVVEAGERFFAPQAVDGPLMMMVAGVALVGNVATALLLARGAKGSLNIRSAFVHIVSDALASVGVIAAGAVVWRYGWAWVDPLLTALIAAYILAQSVQMLRRTVAILMNSAPPDLDYDAMVAAMEAVPGASEVHHVHVWQLDERRTACEAHVVVERPDLQAMERIKRDIKARLQDEFGVGHATLEVEVEACEGAQARVVPHR